jgi:hypothetical protein
MDYVAKAQEASRRWREAQGLPPRADLLSDLSFPSSVPKKDGVSREERERLARECSTTETIETIKESRESRRDNPPTFCPSILLNPQTVKEVLGAKPDSHALACLRFDVVAAVHQLDREVQTGAIGQHPLIVRGIPLGLWVDLAVVARLLREDARR